MAEPDDERQTSRAPKGLSQGAWAAISALGVAIITGLVTLVTRKWEIFDVHPPIPVPEIVQGLPARLVGTWSGVARMQASDPFPIALVISTACGLQERCGTISVPHVPCHGQLTLIKASGGRFEFSVDDFDGRSDPKTCQPGAGEVFSLLPNGNLSYLATYSGATGELTRQ